MDMRRFAPLLIVLVALLGGFATAVAWTYYDLVIRERPLSDTDRAAMHSVTLAGYDAMWRGDHEEAVALWRQREKVNDPVALYYLGNAYAEGEGVPQDWALAHQYLERSAELENARAWSDLGLLYFEGRGLPVDVQKGIEFSTKAGDLGYPQGYANIGVTYRDGLGVDKNLEAALKWSQLAADGDNCTGHAIVGYFHATQDPLTETHRRIASTHYKALRRLRCENAIVSFYVKYRLGILIE